MPRKNFKVLGLRVEMWETSFRVEGMAYPIAVMPGITKEHVAQIIKAIHASVKAKAEAAAREAVLANMRKALGG